MLIVRVTDQCDVWVSMCSKVIISRLVQNCFLSNCGSRRAVFLASFLVFSRCFFWGGRGVLRLNACAEFMHMMGGLCDQKQQTLCGRDLYDKTDMHL